VRTDNPYNPSKARNVANKDKQTTITPAIAAQRLGVEVYTVRRWCDWHAAHLSASASPGAGALRRLTQSDIEVLSMVRDLRAQGLHTETINEQLEGVTFAVVDTDEQSAADSEELAPMASQEGLQQAPPVLVALQAMQTQIDAIQQARQEDRRPRFDIVTAIGLGFVGGLIFMLAVIVLAWLYSGS
jgi:DNA-binding transcriptional MerR regulator